MGVRVTLVTHTSADPLSTTSPHTREPLGHFIHRPPYYITLNDLQSELGITVQTEKESVVQYAACYVPGLYILFFPMVRNVIVNFCSEFLDERVLVRDVEHTSGIGEIIIFYNFDLFKRT